MDAGAVSGAMAAPTVNGETRRGVWGHDGPARAAAGGRQAAEAGGGGGCTQLPGGCQPGSRGLLGELGVRTAWRNGFVSRVSAAFGRFRE